MRKITIGTIVAASLVVSAVAWGGYKGDSVTGVIHAADGSGYAAGNLGYARNSPNTTEYIGCQTDTWTSGGNVYWYMSCQATDAAGHTAYCYSYNDKMVQVAASLDTDGFVHFNWNPSSVCTDLVISHMSYNQPKAP